MIYRFLAITFLFTTLSSLKGQSVQFIYNDLDRGLEKAKQQGKSVFVDTYAKWCIPCKRMSPVFRNPRVANFFNQHFINVKIDMDAPIGSTIKREYDIIFLPTIMVLDQNGKVRYKVDRELSVEELLEIGELTKFPDTYYTSQATAISTTPMGSAASSVTSSPRVNKPKKVKAQKATTEKSSIVPTTNPEEKILHVLDANSDNLPPEILYQEAYFRMELMDGSHLKVAKQYLVTQSDWHVEKNIRFIHDFVNDTDSDEFLFMIINRNKFEKIIGKERLGMTVEILVNRKLYRGFPRPNLEEARALFSYIDPTTSNLRAKEYYLERMYQEKNIDEFKKAASDYLININSQNAEIYYRLADINSQEAKADNEFEICLSQINQAISIDPNQARYYDSKSYILYKIGRREEAMNNAVQCLSLLKKTNQDTKGILKFINEIKASQ